MAGYTLLDDAPTPKGKGYVLLDDGPKIDPSAGGGTFQFGPLDTGIKTPEWLDRGLSGVGKAFEDAGRGVGQIVGQVSREDVKESRKLDAPLNDTTAGKVGGVLGSMALLAPTAFVPGANTVTGAGVVGALTGLAAPSTSTGETLSNVGLGGVSGVAGQYIGGKVADGLTSLFTKSKTAADLANALRKPKAETLAAGQEAGYVVPPSAVNPSWINKRLESIAGKAAVGQEAAVRNQEVTNALARKAAGLADDVPVTEGALKGIREAAAKPYQELAALPPVPGIKASTLTNQPEVSAFNPKQALEDLKQSRNDAQTWFKSYNRSASPEDLKQAQAAAAKASGLENRFEKYAEDLGRNDLLPSLRGARTQIAKTYDIGRAVNVGDASVSAPVIGRLLDKRRPLTGELETIGKMQQAFGPYLREGASIPTPGVSKSEALASALLGIGGSAAGGSFAGPVGSVIGASAAALPLLSGPTRSLILSKPYQSLMAKIPEQGTSTTLKLAESLMKRQAIQNALPALSAQGVLGAAAMLQQD